MGSYTVDKSTEQFGPDRLVIDAKAADMGAQLKEQKRRSWADTTIGAVVDQIAREHGLSAVVSPGLAAMPLAHLDQTDEGDMNLLTRLARERGALAKFADKRLIFAPKGEAKELLSGVTLPLITIDQGECSPGSTLDRRERNNYKSVRAFWYSDAQAERKEVMTGDGRPVYTIRNKYQDAQSAVRAAEAKLAEFRRGALTMIGTLSKGRPEMFAEAPVLFTGFPSHRLPGQRFVLTDVSHSFGDGGYTSRFTAETNPGEDS
jgi:phage protein D